MEQNSKSFHNPVQPMARQRLRRRAVGASWGDGLTQARERQLPAQRHQAVIEKAKHRLTVGADGIGHGAANDGAWAGDPSAALGRHTKRHRHPLIEPQAGVGPAGAQAAEHAEAGAAKKGGNCSPQSRRQLQPWREAWPLHGQRLSAPPGTARTTAQEPLPHTQSHRFMTIKA